MIDKLVPINGKNSQLDYELFSKSVENSIGKKCEKFKIFILNKFPVSLSSGSTFDFIIFISIEGAEGNYFRVKKEEEKNWRYLHNLIIPVKVVSDFYEEDLVVENGEIYDENSVIDYSDYVHNSSYSLKEYLQNKCGLDKNRLELFPIIFIKQKNQTVFFKNHILAENFSFEVIIKYIENSNLSYLISYFPWKSNSQLFEIDVKNIIECASKDSEYGYLTKKKLDRITKTNSYQEKHLQNIGNSLLLIEGKAGSGKSSELVHLMIQKIKSDKNALYLTYNKLLVYDIAKLIKSFSNNYEDKNKPLKEYGVNTLHSFFFRLCKRNMLLNVLSENRINEVIGELKIKMRKIFDFAKTYSIATADDFKEIKIKIQLSDFPIEVKEFGVNFMNYAYLNSKKKEKVPTLKELSKNYFAKAESRLNEVTANEIFLTDYYNVLVNLKLLLNDSDKFYDDYQIADKVSIFNSGKNEINSKYIDDDGDSATFTRSGFKEYNNRKFGSVKRNRILFVDEGQDCADVEKDILFKLFGTHNIVIASGGAEQLIRHKKLCNWTVSESTRIPFIRSVKQAKSYRMKKSVTDLCNFIANYFELPYKLTCDSSEDEGEVIIDFRSQTIENFQPILEKKSAAFNVLGYTNYEGCMILLDSSSLRNGINWDFPPLEEEKSGQSQQIHIDENNNITYSKSKRRQQWSFMQDLENMGYMFWDGTQKNKDQLQVPSSNEIRTLYYESCRGLEAWSVFCFDIDMFFNVKCDEDEADKFMLDDIFTDAESRKKKFAANWILMAMTRAMDTLYLQVNDINSEFGRALKKYTEENEKISSFK